MTDVDGDRDADPDAVAAAIDAAELVAEQRADRIDARIRAAIEALEAIPWGRVDGVSATTAAVFAAQLREALDERSDDDFPPGGDR